MPDGDSSQPTDSEPTDTEAGTEASDTEATEVHGQVFSAYGIASTVLGVVCVAAIALGAVIWSAHRDDDDERAYRSRAMWAAVEWTGVLINMNAENIETSMARLRDGTVGELNVKFGAAIEPVAKVVRQLKAHSTGQIEAVAVESVRHRPEPKPDEPRDQLPPDVASRTDSVVVVATSKAENVAGQPRTVPWNLRLDVSDVDGTLMISGLDLIK